MKARWLLGGLLALFGALYIVFPDYFVARAYMLANDPAANIWLALALGLALIGTGFAAVAEPEDRGHALVLPGALLLAGIVPVLYLVVLSLHLSAWWIDDAGITFAYSRSLAEGLGLVAQPWLPPEEGYSSSIWMLLLSAMARFGVDIPMAAKYLGIGFSAVSMILCAFILARELRSPLAIVMCGTAIACGPTVVWAVSGQEHALQSLLLLLVVACVWWLENWRLPVAGILSVLVLTRPEAPIIVIGVFVAAVFLTRRSEGALINVGDIAVALVPLLTFLALMAFRMAYFGDLFPNPYYAKSSGAGLAGVLNPLGGGWAYILAGLRDTAVLLVLALVALIRAKRIPDWIIVALAVLAGHVIFVVWAKGDWMGQYRFLMPILPVALLVAALGLQGLPTRKTRTIFAVVAVLILTHTTVLQLSAFKASPTTPLAVVTEVGNTFRALSDRLEIEDPLLAHHDAGGIAYHRMIRLVDLGGLINRTIAKNMDDAAFLTPYLVDDVQPDFFFGARNFAAASGFAEMQAFDRNYVPLEFIGLPFMRSTLSYIRRNRVIVVPGVEQIFDARGDLVGVRVNSES